MDERIVIDPKVCHGKFVVRGTRTPVTAILDALAGGDSFETIMEDFSITIEDIRACIAFASSEISQQSLNANDILAVLPGRLAIVAPGRIRLRPKP